MDKTLLKNIGAVVIGIIVIVALSIVTDTVLEQTGIFPPPTEGLFVTWMLALALAYRTIYAFVGGYVVAGLSASKPLRNVMVLNIIGIVMGTLGSIANWDKSATWYPIGVVVLSAVAVWLGGKMKISKK